MPQLWDSTQPSRNLSYRDLGSFRECITQEVNGDTRNTALLYGAYAQRQAWGDEPLLALFGTCYIFSMLLQSPFTDFGEGQRES